MYLREGVSRGSPIIDISKHWIDPVRDRPIVLICSTGFSIACGVVCGVCCLVVVCCCFAGVDLE